MLKAHFDLAEIQQMVSDTLDKPARGKIIYSAKSKSIDRVISAFKSRGRYLNSKKAEAYICYRLLELSATHFYQTEAGQWGDPKFITDQYGMRHEGIPWFIKFSKDDETGKLDQISFHPLDRDMKLASGETLKKEWSSR